MFYGKTSVCAYRVYESKCRSAAGVGSRRRSAASRPPPLSRTPASEFRGALSDAPAPAARVPRWTGPSRDRAWRPGRRGAEDSGDLHSDRGGRPFSLLSRGRFASPDFTCELKCHLAATLRIGRGLEVLTSTVSQKLTRSVWPLGGTPG